MSREKIYEKIRQHELWLSDNTKGCDNCYIVHSVLYTNNLNMMKLDQLGHLDIQKEC